jgi:hypothetical protein
MRLSRFFAIITSGLGVAPSWRAAEPVPLSVPHQIPLSVSGWTHIEFEGIPPTVYRNDAEQPAALVAVVKRSSSFLLRPLAEATTVHRVSFEWRSDGELHVKDASEERSKAGDDGFLRLGLLLSGPPPLMPFFAPAWVKAIRGRLQLPSDHLLYLMAGAKSAAGEHWTSPYSDSLELLAVASEPLKDGWKKSAVAWPSPLKVVGLWLMADGDDTKSDFTTMVRDLRLD